MLATLIDVLTAPGRFFQRRPDPSLREPAVVVVACGLATSLSATVLLWPFRHLVGTAELVVSLVLLAGLLPLLAGVQWVVVTGFLYVGSVAVSPETSVRGLVPSGEGRPLARSIASGEGGSGRRLLAYVGWGLLPQVLGWLVLAGAAVVVVSQLEPPVDEPSTLRFARQFSGGQLLALSTAAGTAGATTTSSYSTVKLVVGVAETLWSGYVWVAALEQARGISWARAAVPTGILVALVLVVVVL